MLAHTSGPTYDHRDNPISGSAHATGVECWARRHPWGLRGIWPAPTVSGRGTQKRPSLRGRLEQPVTEGLQLEGGAVRLADALEHAAAHAVEPNGPRSEGAQQRVIKAVDV